MSSRLLRNPGRLCHNHSGMWSASLCGPGSSCGCAAQKELGDTQKRKIWRLSLSEELLPLSVEHVPTALSPTWGLLSILNGSGMGGAMWVTQEGRVAGTQHCAVGWEGLEMIARRLHLTTVFREVFPGIASSAGQHVRVVAFTTCFVTLSCHLLGRLGLT